MYRVDIYLEIELDALKTTRNRYGYVLECEKNGKTHTLSGYGERIGTKNQVTLSALIDALKRLNQNCEVHIYTSNDYVVGMINNCLDAWIRNGYKTAKGVDIANIEEWQQVAKLMKYHLVKTEKGNHVYTEKMKYEMRRKEVKV